MHSGRHSHGLYPGYPAYDILPRISSRSSPCDHEVPEAATPAASEHHDSPSTLVANSPSTVKGSPISHHTDPDRIAGGMSGFQIPGLNTPVQAPPTPQQAPQHASPPQEQPTDQQDTEQPEFPSETPSPAPKQSVSPPPSQTLADAAPAIASPSTGDAAAVVAEAQPNPEATTINTTNHTDPTELQPSPSPPSGPPTRFEQELEFVQMLSSPLYLNHLASQKYLQSPEFINYLHYLRYWTRPEYVKLLQYPATTLQALDLLTAEGEAGVRFRREILSPEVCARLMGEWGTGAVRGR